MSKLTVLVVDDEDDIREVVQMSLEFGAGWEVLTASSGTEAISKATESGPDLILLDVMMPGMDGPETFRQLQNEGLTRQIPVIFLTAKVQRTELLDLHELGAKGLISKPFDPMSLTAQIQEIVGDGA
ncbi:MAG: response regulator [bacterium]|nr:response regulator [bacterium]